MTKYGLLLFVGTIVLIASCKKDKTEIPTCVEEISYAQQVKLVLDLNCTTAGCHDASAAGGYNLITHTNVAANAELILSVINHESGFTPMPMGGSQLADSTIQHFSCWIEQGKQNN